MPSRLCHHLLLSNRRIGGKDWGGSSCLLHGFLFCSFCFVLLIFDFWIGCLCCFDFWLLMFDVWVFFLLLLESEAGRSEVGATCSREEGRKEGRRRRAAGFSYLDVSICKGHGRALTTWMDPKKRQDWLDVVDVVEGFVKTKPEAIRATHENVNLRRVVRVWNISNGQMGRELTSSSLSSWG